MTIVIIIVVVVIILLPCFSYQREPELEGQQVSSGLHEPFSYSVRSEECSSLEGLYSSTNFQLFLPSIQTFQAHRL